MLGFGLQDTSSYDNYIHIGADSTRTEIDSCLLIRIAYVLYKQYFLC